MPALTKFVTIIIFLLSFVITPKTYAYFVDDFEGNSLNNDVWQEYNNSGQIIVNNGKLTVLGSNMEVNTFPYIFSRTNIFPDSGSFSVEVKFRYLSVENFGSGLVFSPQDVPTNLSSSLNINNTILLNIWQDKPNGLMINKLLCNSDGNECNNIKSVIPITGIPDFNDHIVKINYSDDGRYTVYFDNSNDPVYISGSNQKRLNKIWIGNPLRTNTTDYWSSFVIESIKISPVFSIGATIIVPGMGASWDFDALLNGTNGTEWKIPDFVKVYDGLIGSFDNTDEYTLNQNLFVFTYDWRKPIDMIADDLKTYIADLPLEPGQKINLVGHSMGGLVARAYAQENESDNRINHMYLLGAPNNGTVKAYGTWEGAEIWDDAWWSKTALAITSHLGANLGETQIDSIRRIVPSIKDMLPTNDFIYLNGLILPWSNLSQKNTFLKDLNDDYQTINNKVTNIASDDVSTKQYINAEPRSLTDELLEKWEDGKPKEDNPFQSAPGDGTLTYDEARGPFSDNVDGVGGHGDLVTSIDNIKLLFRKMGLDESKAIPGSMESIDFENVLTAILRSPGKLEVCDTSLVKCNEQLGYYFPESKLFILPGYNHENLVVRVYEEGLGNYSLHLGNLSNTANWKVVNGSLERDGQIDYYNIKGAGDDLLVMKDETGPTTPFITGFTNPEMVCGGVTNAHSVTVDWSDSEDESGVAGYVYYVDYPIVDQRGLWTTFLKTSQYRGSLNEGIHYIKVRAKDRAGNLSEWSNICSLTADWTAPIVNILSPSQSVYLPSQLPELSYTVNDNLDPNPEITISGYSKENGDHVISITAKDKAGNVGSATVSYTIQAPPSNKNQCKNGGWKLFTLSRFRNQGECVSFVERNPIALNKYFWWI